MRKLPQERLLRRLVRDTLSTLAEMKPGGGLTDFGALYRLEKNEAIAQARAALVSAGGDVDKAAKILDVSPSTVRYYLDLQPSLEKTKEKEESKDDKKANESRVRKAYFDAILEAAEEAATAGSLSPEDYAKKAAAKLAAAGENGIGMLTRAYGSQGISIVLYKTNVFAGNIMASLNTEQGRGGDTQLIADATERSIVGMITLGEPDSPCAGAMVVKYVFTTGGYGQTLYDIAMQLSPSGRIISDRTATSDKALKNVYAKMQARPDIKKIPLDDIKAHDGTEVKYDHPNHTDDPSDDCEVWGGTRPEREILDYAYMGSGNVDLTTLKRNHDEAMKTVNRYVQKYYGWSPSFAGDYLSQVADFMFTNIYHSIPVDERGLKG